ncbi:MAG: hypothetical protein LBE60_05980 [Microbacterium sp.]|jgi:hypothetical protein|uniref:hypothetical protein n=1 Tax=Microbacterium sp. TaxID=51671 RepID=UPI002832F3F6|nr:hypothetical protein [Microbacterium sp.]MDR2321179.1 hypothetical protein [Microbacterium sp.]
MRARRRIALAAVALLAALTTGCSAPFDPAAWTLEPIPYTPRGMKATDVSYAQAALAPDGSGGFWGVSSTTWLHVGAEAETLAHVNVAVDSPGSQPALLAPLSATELLTADRNALTRGHSPLGVLETGDMSWREVPSVLDDDGIASITGIAADGRDVLVGLLRPAARGTTGPLALEVVRIGLDDGSRALLHTETISVASAEQGRFAATTATGVLSDGTVLLTTPNGLSLLAADGSVLDRIPSDEPVPLLAIGPDDQILWWGHPAGSAGTPSHPPAAFQVRGGSAEARTSIETASKCADGRRLQFMSAAGGLLRETARLPFLCGARAAIWTGSSWVVSIGGEGDGVLVRVTPPKKAG